MKRIVLFLLIVVLLIGLGATFLLATERGLRWTLGGAGTFLPGKLTVERAGGRIIGPLEITGLQYEHDAASIRVQSFMFDWRPAALFSRRVHATNLHAEGLTVRLRPQEAAPLPRALPELRLPLLILLQNVSLRDVTIYPAGAETPLVVESLGTDMTLGLRTLEIHDFNLRMPRLRVQAAGEIEPRGNYPLDLRITWSAEPAGGPLLQGEGTVKGTVKKLEMVQHLRGPGEAVLTGIAKELLSSPAWEGELVVREVSLQKVQTPWPDVHLAGRVSGEGTARRMSFRGGLSLSDKRYGKALLDFAVQGEDGGWDISKLTVSRPEESARIEVAGNYRVESGEPRVDLRGQWQALQWPPAGKDPQVRSALGEFSLRGAPDAYTVQASATLAGRRIPEGRWTLGGSGSRTALVLDTVQGILLDGELSGRSEVRWRPELTWEVQTEAKGLNPGKYWPQWPGRLALTLRASRKGTGRTSLSVSRLAGVLRGHPFQAAGSVELLGKNYSLKDVALRSGSAELKASGSVTERWDLVWEIGAANLSDLFPDGAGRLRGTGTVTGARKIPRITAALQGTELAVRGTRVGAVEADLDLNLAQEEASRLQVNGSSLVLGGQTVGRLRLDGTGTISAHRLALNAVSDEAALDATVAGGYGKGRWAGSIEDVRLAAIRLGVWELVQPGEVTVARDTLATEDLCWASDPSQVCLRADWRRGAEGRAQLKLTQLPLAVFQSGLPPTLEPEGSLDGEADVTYTADKTVRGSASLKTEGGTLTYAAGYEAPLRLRFDAGALELRTEGADLTAELALALAQGGAVEGVLRIAPFSPLDRPPGEKRLSGSLRGEMRELGWLPAFLPQLSDVKGTVRSDLVLGGSLRNPTVRGSVMVADANAAVPVLGIRLEGVRLDAVSRGDTSVSIIGEAASGGGRIELRGDIDLTPEAGFPARLTVRGENMEIVNLPEARLLASPDLKIRFEREGIDVSGQVHVPSARIEPLELSGGVPRSRDVVIVTAETAEAAAPRRRIVTRVRLTLGDDVLFNGFGLTGRITGSVTAVDTPEKLTTGQGELQILEGKYRAYGQNLDIERGRLLFTGGPIDDPGLDVRAVRRTGELESGVDVRGSLREPRMELYSSPSLDQSDALSYLVLGRPTDQATGAEGQMLYDAALSLGLTGGGLLAERIGSTFGIEEIEIERGNAVEDATVFIGKYLSPRLYVSYGIGLFDPVSTFRLRYQISSKWLVQTEYGFESGGDLIYRIERD